MNYPALQLDILDEFVEASRMRTRQEYRGLRIRTYSGEATSPIPILGHRSISEAARAIGCRHEAIRRRMRRGVPLDAPGGARPAARRLRAANGTIYGSVSEAAAGLHVTPKTIRNYIKCHVLRELPPSPVRP